MIKKDLVILLSSIFIFVFIWIVFNIYHNSISSTIPEAINAQLFFIAPNFDTKTIDKLKKRQSVTPIFQSGTPINPTISPSEVIQVISSGSAQKATSGGSLLP
nr:hypothetical protein [Candidatus Levybacteria bacterium]